MDASPEPSVRTHDSNFPSRILASPSSDTFEESPSPPPYTNFYISYDTRSRYQHASIANSSTTNARQDHARPKPEHQGPLSPKSGNKDDGGTLAASDSPSDRSSSYSHSPKAALSHACDLKSVAPNQHNSLSLRKLTLEKSRTLDVGVRPTTAPRPFPTTRPDASPSRMFIPITSSATESHLQLSFNEDSLHSASTTSVDTHVNTQLLEDTTFDLPAYACLSPRSSTPQTPPRSGDNESQASCEHDPMPLSSPLKLPPSSSPPPFTSSPMKPHLSQESSNEEAFANEPALENLPMSYGNMTELVQDGNHPSSKRKAELHPRKHMESSAEIDEDSTPLFEAKRLVSFLAQSMRDCQSELHRKPRTRTILQIPSGRRWLDRSCSARNLRVHSGLHSSKTSPAWAHLLLLCVSPSRNTPSP